jgi:hypothetical protein
VPVRADIALDQLDVTRAIAERPVAGKLGDPAAHDQYRFRNPALQRFRSPQAPTVGRSATVRHGLK